MPGAVYMHPAIRYAEKGGETVPYAADVWGCAVILINITLYGALVERGCSPTVFANLPTESFEQYLAQLTHYKSVWDTSQQDISLSLIHI